MPDDTPTTIVIPLTKGYTATIDEIDSDLVQYKWSSHVGPRGKAYAWRRPGKTSERKNIYLHKVILERIIGRPLNKGEMADHINGKSTDNCRSNLRVATRTQNNRNQRLRKDNTTGYKGVLWDPRRNRWFARIHVNGVRISSKYFRTPEEAYVAYCDLAVMHFGEFANLGIERATFNE